METKVVKLGQRCTVGNIYYEDDRPYPGDAAARLACVVEIHRANPKGGFNLLDFGTTEYVARGSVRAVWTRALFERVR